MVSVSTPLANSSSSVKNVTASTPSLRFCQNSLRFRAPGKRPAIPITAISRPVSSSISVKPQTFFVFCASSWLPAWRPARRREDFLLSFGSVLNPLEVLVTVFAAQILRELCDRRRLENTHDGNINLEFLFQLRHELNSVQRRPAK